MNQTERRFATDTCTTSHSDRNPITGAPRHNSDSSTESRKDPLGPPPPRRAHRSRASRTRTVQAPRDCLQRRDLSAQSECWFERGTSSAAPCRTTRSVTLTDLRFPRLDRTGTRRCARSTLSRRESHARRAPFRCGRDLAALRASEPPPEYIQSTQVMNMLPGRGPLLARFVNKKLRSDWPKTRHI